MGKKVAKPPAAKSAPGFFISSVSFVLSHIAFVATHLVFVYWLNFFANDPFNTGLGATLDVKHPLPAEICTKYNKDAILNNIFWFSVWTLQHFIMSRKIYKVALGLWEHPLERPLFATGAWVCWLLQIHKWQPITDCVTFSIFEVSPLQWAISGGICAAGAALIVGLLWTLPQHVFGTDRYKYAKGKYPHQTTLITWFPYGLVRHPAAAGFLWVYWFFPSYTPNHFLLAAMWTVFIFVGTLGNEEGGLTGPDEFGQKYVKYQKEVSAFHPNLQSLKRFVGLAPPLKIE